MNYRADEPPEENSISFRLREERERLGLSAKELAKALKIGEMKLRWAESHAGDPLGKLKPIHFCEMAVRGFDVNYIFSGQRQGGTDQTG